MTAGSNHLGDAIQDFLDGRLDAPGRARAEAHLEACAECRAELDAFRWVKSAARDAGREALPAHIVASVRAALDREDETVHAPAPDRPHGIFTWPRLLVAGIVLAALAAAWLVQQRRDHGLPARVAQDLVDYGAGRLPLELHTSDTRKLEDFYAAKRLGFEVRVYDLAMMDFRAVGGRVHALRGRPAAFFVYEGPEGRILVCEMFRARLTELPAGANLRRHNGIDFRVYRRDGITMVFWQEGEVVCVLTSRGDPEEVIQLAFAKAVRSARNERHREGRMAG